MRVLASRYELLDKIGEGGMSVVWLARDRELEREVAIKLLRSFAAEDTAQSQRFHREARALAALAHEHIVRIYDYVSGEEQSFLVMEYVAGGNLAQTTRGQLPLSLGEAATYLKPVARALAYAHARGVAHRDLTPSNILIERGSGRVVTTDFGLARITRSTGSLTATGVLLGTPEYWSPELALGRESAAPSDVYALGCILFLLLSGELPFVGDDRLAVGLRRAHEDAPSLRALLPDAPEKAVALVDSLLARDPKQRPDASDIAAGLGELAEGSTARPVGLDEARPTDLPTIALASETGTTELPAPAVTVQLVRPTPAESSKWGDRWARRRVLGAVGASAAVIVGALVLAGEVRDPLRRVPNVVSLREDVARTQIRHSLPTATVTVQRIYSTRVGAGLVIRQRPGPRERLAFGKQVQLVVSKGTPFAPVPALAGEAAATATASLARQGFASRYTYRPSWTVHKGSVVGLRPHAGTRLHRPARVTIVVASGYPRSVVPDLRNTDLSSAQQELASHRLRYRLVWRLTDAAPPGRVLDQIPAGGTSVYEGAQIRLTVARSLRWVRLFGVSGSDDYEGNVFTVPDRWRVRYRLATNDFGLALARFGWMSADGVSGHSFFASSAGALRTYVSSDGAGSYRLAVRSYAGTHWYVEVDALK
jgi:beta-lactam-binding protein with PASTA domain/predicted Ser/Thr protein kinase